MREIRFRGKPVCEIEELQEVMRDGWLYGYLIGTDVLVGEVVDIDSDGISTEWWCRVDPATVGQFTGLKDKNGKEIYEGDVVKYGDTIHEVVFEQRNNTAYFGLVYSPEETRPFGYYQDLQQIEVIGNIHDNPELLKEVVAEAREGKADA